MGKDKSLSKSILRDNKIAIVWNGKKKNKQGRTNKGKTFPLKS